MARSLSRRSVSGRDRTQIFFLLTGSSTSGGNWVCRFFFLLSLPLMGWVVVVVCWSLDSIWEWMKRKWSSSLPKEGEIGDFTGVRA
ncbi:hypothetical protein ACOSP7_000880 [Xanthoceras sorbifolium]